MGFRIIEPSAIKFLSNFFQILQKFSISTLFKDIFLLLQNAGGKIEKNEMGRACGAYGGGERCAQGFGGEA
jgi:hypothetical protein